MTPLEIITIINAAMQSVQSLMNLLQRVESGQEITDEELEQLRALRQKLVDEF